MTIFWLILNTCRLIDCRSIEILARKSLIIIEIEVHVYKLLSVDYLLCAFIFTQKYIGFSGHPSGYPSIR